MKRKLAVLILFVASIAQAQTSDADLERRLEQLRTEVRQLTELLGRLLEVEEKSQKQAAPLTTIDGFEMKSGETSVRFGGYAQFDGRLFEVNSPGVSAFEWRRLRPELRGDLPNNMRYRIQADFAGDSAELVDGYMEWDACPYSTLRAGQFKEPFSLESLQSAPYLDLMERSMIVTAFAPLFDVGAASGGTFWDDKIQYGVGVFNGRGRNIEENNDDKDIAARLVVEILEGLYLGASGTHGEQDGDIAGDSYRSAGDVPFIRYADGVTTDGYRDRWGADMEWYYGPASLKAEWLGARQENISNGGTNENVTFDGYYITATYFLTGEDKPRNRALKDVSIKNGTWGAWELVIRFDEFNADQSLFDTGLAAGTDRAQASTLGLNWYPNNNIRVMGNLVHVRYDDDITANGETADDEDVAMLRLQYSL